MNPSQREDTCYMQDTYTDLVEYHPSMLCRLTEYVLRVYPGPIMEQLRTFHDHPYIAHETMNHTQCLRNSHPRFVLGQSIQSLENCLNFALPQQLLRELFCDTWSHGQGILGTHLLNRPCLICLVARASTESNSTNILTMISVIIGVGGIVV